MGLRALRPASYGASTRSLTVPIANCRNVIEAPSRSASGGARAPRSDVDQLVEVGDEVRDQPLAAVRDLRPDARHERPEGDSRDHQPALGGAPDARWGSTPGGKDALEAALIEPRRLTEIRHD